jgi:hypothetical protein
MSSRSADASPGTSIWCPASCCQLPLLPWRLPLVLLLPPFVLLLPPAASWLSKSGWPVALVVKP